MKPSTGKLCPSSVGTEGALILGLVQGNQTVALLPQPIPITKEFVEEAQKHGDLEKRFRFANKCVKSGCSQWTGSQCGVIDLLAKVNAQVSLNAPLKMCAIRSRCRWFSEQGRRACDLCLYVITDNQDGYLTQEIPNPLDTKVANQ